MKDVRKTYYFLMIFLLIWFVVPLKQLYAQQENSQKMQPQEVIEQQILDHLRAGNAYGQQGNTIELSGYLDASSELNSRREELLDGKNGNYVNLVMDGNSNYVTAKQEKGTGNAMEIEIDGNYNNLNYLQQGNNNYLYDGVFGDYMDYSITQTGNELGLYLQGQQTIPNMIINQRGNGMKLRITGSPPIKK
jgi:hypothetical protein